MKNIKRAIAHLRTFGDYKLNKLADMADAELDEARNKLNDAIELAEEGISYTSPYFVEKWGMADNLVELKKYRDQSRNP